MLVHGLPPRDYSHADIRRKRCQLCKAGPVVVLGARRKDRLDAIGKDIQGDGGKALATYSRRKEAEVANVRVEHLSSLASETRLDCTLECADSCRRLLAAA